VHWLQDPATPNQGWSVEIAVPIASLQERQAAAGCGADSATTPVEGTKWRLGFSRVNWRILVVNEGPGGAPIYIKDPEQPEEDNWVWSAQGRVAMHEPEHWVSHSGGLLSRRGRSSAANASGLDTHRDSITRRFDCRAFCSLRRRPP
jgi:hypothetical protein